MLIIKRDIGINSPQTMAIWWNWSLILFFVYIGPQVILNCVGLVFLLNFSVKSPLVSKQKFSQRRFSLSTCRIYGKKKKNVEEEDEKKSLYAYIYTPGHRTWGGTRLMIMK